MPCRMGAGEESHDWKLSPEVHVSFHSPGEGGIWTADKLDVMSGFLKKKKRYCTDNIYGWFTSRALFALEVDVGIAVG